MVSTPQTYRGRLQVSPTDHLEVDLRVLGNELVLVSSGGALGTWPIDEVDVVRVAGDQFRLDLAGEQATFFANDVIAFSYVAMPSLTTSSIWSPVRKAIRQWRVAGRVRVAFRHLESGIGEGSSRVTVLTRTALAKHWERARRAWVTFAQPTPVHRSLISEVAPLQASPPRSSFNLFGGNSQELWPSTNPGVTPPEVDGKP
ncbi:MAG: hypothetical protein ACRDWA_09000 [Acidimicrobiia bacterium]